MNWWLLHCWNWFGGSRWYIVRVFVTQLISGNNGIFPLGSRFGSSTYFFWAVCGNWSWSWFSARRLLYWNLKHHFSTLSVWGQDNKRIEHIVHFTTIHTTVHHQHTTPTATKYSTFSSWCRSTKQTSLLFSRGAAHQKPIRSCCKFHFSQAQQVVIQAIGIQKLCYD